MVDVSFVSVVCFVVLLSYVNLTETINAKRWLAEIKFTAFSFDWSTSDLGSRGDVKYDVARM